MTGRISGNKESVESTRQGTERHVVLSCQGRDQVMSVFHGVKARLKMPLCFRVEESVNGHWTTGQRFCSFALPRGLFQTGVRWNLTAFAGFLTFFGGLDAVWTPGCGRNLSNSVSGCLRMQLSNRDWIMFLFAHLVPCSTAKNDWSSQALPYICTVISSTLAGHEASTTARHFSVLLPVDCPSISFGVVKVVGAVVPCPGQRLLTRRPLCGRHLSQGKRRADSGRRPFHHLILLLLTPSPTTTSTSTTSQSPKFFLLSPVLRAATRQIAPSLVTFPARLRSFPFHDLLRRAVDP